MDGRQEVVSMIEEANSRTPRRCQWMRLMEWTEMHRIRTKKNATPANSKVNASNKVYLTILALKSVRFKSEFNQRKIIFHIGKQMTTLELNNHHFHRDAVKVQRWKDDLWDVRSECAWGSLIKSFSWETTLLEICLGINSDDDLQNLQNQFLEYST